jgi:hypothetical protein
VTLILHYHNRWWQTVAFDTTLGTGQVRWFRRRPAVAKGWATKHHGQWYAVWSNGENLVLQIGTQQIPMTEEYVCRNVQSGTERTLTITAGSKRVLELEYAAVSRNEDPTFDDIDLESEDFFVWLCRLWNDPKWKKDAIHSWRA